MTFGILLAFASVLQAQFYNGHQMKFGKNRVQFDEFEWYYFRFQNFDTYFVAGSKDVALKASSIANKNLSEIETFLEHQLKKRIVFVIYKNQSDFRQSNIGLNTGDEQYNIGGVVKVVDNIAFIFVEGDLKSLERQVKSAIANVFLNELLYGDNITSKIANNTLISPPEWYFQGLLRFVSQKWDSEIDNLVRNAIADNKFDNLNHLNGDDAAIAGHAIWNYIATVYGKQVIPNIVYLSRVTKSTESAFLYVLGFTLENLQDAMVDFYKAQYTSFAYTAETPSGRSILPKTRKHLKYYQVQHSANGEKIAWVENHLGKYKIKYLDLKTNKKKKILRREHVLDQIPDYSYPVLRWHPSGKMLGFIIEKKGSTYYTTYNLETKEFKEIEVHLEKITSFDYSHDGLYLVLSAFHHGQSDIFVFNIIANTIENITQDVADDYQPVFVNKSQQIVFSSNRKEAELGNKKSNKVEVQENKDIFLYDVKTKTIEQITNTETVNEESPDLKNKNFTFISDENGIKNLYAANIDSAINFVDTTTHYRYFLNQTQLTNYPNNILEYNPDNFSNSNAMLYKNKNRFQLLYNENLPNNPLKPEKTAWRKYHENQLKKVVISAKQQEIPETDSLSDTSQGSDIQIIDINNYEFDEKVLKANKIESEEFDKDGNAKDPRTLKYHTTFYTNYLVSQIDFGFLSNSYQTFTGSAFYFNPGFNMILKLATYDLFEDYRITAGFRFAGNFDSNEYLLSFENLKKRWNKQLVLHRQALNNYAYDYYFKSYTHEAFYILRYPLSQVDAFQFTFNLRQNHYSLLAIDFNSLKQPDFYDYWAGAKAEYIFDNTKALSTNILSGTRFKVFGESYVEMHKRLTDLFVTGYDFRYYKPIHKNFIFAFRVAGSASFGTAKLIYYLGGMDNWINLSAKNPTFNQDIKIDPEVNYVYQAVATNLRGFNQNIRNGTNFTVVNAELRLPVVTYFYKKPLNNNFLKDFQVIAFFDIGSAWSGLSPFSGNNAYENDYYNDYPVSVIVYNNNFPIVSGYGFGLRSKLLGYFVRADWAWGINGDKIQPRMFYLSLSTDF